MSFPWASLGGAFLFRREEQPIFGTDLGWVQNPQYSQQVPLGSLAPSIVTTAITMQRTFEVNLAQDRLKILRGLINSAYLFTDWAKPTPDSRQAFLASVDPADQGFRAKKDTNGNFMTTRVKITLISQ